MIQIVLNNLQIKIILCAILLLKKIKLVILYSAIIIAKFVCTIERRCFLLEKMLKKIILADKQARGTVEKAQQQQQELEDKIKQVKLQFEKNYWLEAEKNISDFKAEKEKLLKEENENLEKKISSQIKGLEEKYNGNKNIWIKTMTDKILE